MLSCSAAILYALALWWFSTGAILYLGGLPSRTHRHTLVGATIVLALALAGLAATRDEPGVPATYAAFTCAILVWGWIETTFLLGALTGPQRTPCPPGARGWRRFVPALRAVLHHDLAILASILVVLALVGGGTNTVGLTTILILALMRLSAQVNLYLGVPNRAEELLPDRLRHLASFFADRRMNPLFPVSVTLGTAVAAGLVRAALDPDASEAQTVAAMLPAALLALGILEHWFMVLPIRASALWQWGLRSRRTPLAQPPALTPLVGRSESLSP